MFEVYQAVHVVGKIVRKGTHHQKKQNQAQHVAGYLYNGLEEWKQMGPQENEDDKNAQCFKQKKSVPQNIGSGVNKFPFKKSANGKIKGIPNTNEEIGPSPDFRYVIKPFQSFGKFYLKINDSRLKPLKCANGQWINGFSHIEIFWKQYL